MILLESATDAHRLAQTVNPIVAMLGLVIV
jgi:hypothetical protein